MKVRSLKTCDTCRKAIKWLKDKGFDPVILDIRDTPPQTSEISEYMEKVGWEKLLNRRSATWRTLSDNDKSDITNEKAVELIVKHPTLMKRPVTVVDNEIIVGFDQNAIARLKAMSS